MSGNGNVKEISRNIRVCLTQICKHDTRMFRNLPIEHLQGCFWHVQTLEVLVVIFQKEPVILSRPVDLIRSVNMVEQTILGGKRLSRRTSPLPLFIELVTVGPSPGLANEFLSRLALQPPGLIVSKQEVVCRVERSL